MSQTVLVSCQAVRRLPVRPLLAGVLILALTAGYVATPQTIAADAAMQAGAELTRLLRMMAGLKLALIAGAAWMVDWRLRFPVRPGLSAGYFGGLAMAAVGPGLIWSMAHVALGAVLLHGGLVVLAAVFCLDPGSPAMLRGRLRARR